MGDLIDLQSRIARVLETEETPEFDAFLVAEGLELLAEFRSIQDPAVRKSIMQMVSRIAAALRAAPAV
jgi:hypothetical protein